MPEAPTQRRALLDADDDDDFSRGAIAGIILGILIIGFFCFGLYYYMRRRMQGKQGLVSDDEGSGRSEYIVKARSRFVVIQRGTQLVEQQASWQMRSVLCVLQWQRGRDASTKGQWKSQKCAEISTSPLRSLCRCCGRRCVLLGAWHAFILSCFG